MIQLPREVFGIHMPSLKKTNKQGFLRHTDVMNQSFRLNPLETMDRNRQKRGIQTLRG